MENLSVDFYTEQEAAVTVRWSADTAQAKDPETGRFSDVLMFACHAIRMLRNRDFFGDGLAGALTRWKPKHIESTGSIEALHTHVTYSGWIPPELRKQAEKYQWGPPIVLVPYKGVGNKRIVGTLKVTNKNKPVFGLDYKGFGFLSRDVPMFATDSVIMHLTFLNQKYNSNPTFLEGLSLVARECADAYNDKTIMMGNQEDLALQYVNRHCRTQA